ncbi:MAG: hypothetical protein KIT87_27520 [Anaerolineae bacterium]|nr:hypothetical protein [Anaerolineae bacterium]
MSQRVLQRLAFVALLVTAVAVTNLGARASTSDVTPQAYLPLISRAAAEAAWSLIGNAGTNPAVNFLGTTDGAALSIQPGAGNVGVGTTAPVSKLHVVSSAGQLPPRLEAPTSPSFAAGLDFYHGSTGQAYVGVPSAGAGIGPNELLLFASTGITASIWTDRTRRLTVDTNGNVGIGTATPVSKLNIASGRGDSPPRLEALGGSFGAGWDFYHGTTGKGYVGVPPAGQNLAPEEMVLYGTTGVKTSIWAGATRSLTVDTNGNVGVGTAPTNARIEAAVDCCFGVVGRAATGIGVAGYNTNSWGVLGQSQSSVGVVAKSRSGNLMEGYMITGGQLDARRFYITNDGAYIHTGGDFAEALPAVGGKTGFEPGDVVVLSAEAAGGVEKATAAYDSRVAGVYATNPSVIGANKADGVARIDANDVPVAIVGVVPTKVSAENGAIQTGDLLTTSATPGYAMRCDDKVKCIGAIVGKAMEPLAAGAGVIKVLVTLR